jgi:hypothetical protein
MDDSERRQWLMDQARLDAASHDRSKVVGLLLTFFFPFLGFLYSGNYGWAAIAFGVDVANFVLIFLLGVGLITGLLWRLLALIIANDGIDRHRRRAVRSIEAGDYVKGLKC